jgi:Fic family protein
MNRADLVEAVRARLHRFPEPYQAQYGVVPLPPPEEAIPVGDAGATAEAARLALTEIETIARELKDPFLISRVLTRKEAVSSSAIEGTNSTLDELLAAEETDREDATSATRQVQDYALALEALVPQAQERGPDIFSLDLIRGLHRDVMASDPDYQDVPGELRRRVVWIGGAGHIASSTYNPGPPDSVEESLRENVDYLKNQGVQAMTQGLITRMAVAHAHFEAVHPFRDGNGRVGRLLLPLMMSAEGHIPLYLSPYIEANKGNYYAALKAAQQRLDWPAIIGFISDAIIGTVAEIKRTRTDLRNLQATWRQRRSFRKGSGALQAIDILHEYPIVTTKRMQKLLGVSFPAASTAIQQLVEIGVLVERTGYRRNRLFAAEEAIRILNRPFGEP